MSEMKYHMVRPENAEGICELIQSELGYTDVTADDVRSSIEKMLASDDYFTIVVEDNGAICAFISSVREISLESGEYYRITGLAVKSAYQGSGLGTTLLTLAEGNAKCEGARLITLSSRFERTEAHEFYEKLGYSKTSYAFKKFF